MWIAKELIIYIINERQKVTTFWWVPLLPTQHIVIQVPEYLLNQIFSSQHKKRMKLILLSEWVFTRIIPTCIKSDFYINIYTSTIFSSCVKFPILKSFASLLIFFCVLIKEILFNIFISCLLLSLIHPGNVALFNLHRHSYIHYFFLPFISK